MAVDISHFSMVGLAIDTHDGQSLSRTAQAYLSSCATHELRPTDLVCVVTDPSGAELRFGLRRAGDGTMQIATINPAFSGEGRAAVEVVASHPEEQPFETTVSARFAGDETPLVFDLAEPFDAAVAIPGARLTVDLAAFSFRPDVFQDEAAFDQSQSGHEVKYASYFFIPSGLFFDKVGGAMPDDAKRPVAYADLAGTVLKAELRSNAGRKFWWALVKTYTGQTIDVVMDPRSLTREPSPGTIITGRFWLSAHVVSTDVTPPSPSSTTPSAPPARP